MESGNIFRNQVIQKRLTPQSILESSTLDDKFPILLKHAKNPSIMRHRINKAIQIEKDHLLQILLISINTTAKWLPVEVLDTGEDTQTDNVKLHKKKPSHKA